MKQMTAAGKLLQAGFGVLALMICGTGCSFTPTAFPFKTAEYYLINLSECKETDLENDKQIVRCASQVEEILRQRYNNARVARSGGGLIQVITAGASSLITGLGGANGLTAGTILSGISAMMPEVSNVIEAKDRAEAYADGMKSIGTALGVYRMSIVESNDGAMNSFRMTTAGATLYVTLRAAISVVESRLANLLPSTEDLKKARSELDRFEKVEVIPSSLTLTPTGKATLTIVNGGQVRAASGNNSIATVTEDATSGGTKFNVAATGANCQTTTVALANTTGGRESVIVRIENDSSFVFSTKQIVLKSGATSPSVTLQNAQACPINKAVSNDEIAKVMLDPTRRQVMIKAEAVTETKTTTIRIESDTGRQAMIDVIVNP
jgi:hypothetical protein